MNKLILLTAVMALALVPALRADDVKPKNKPATCESSKPECGKCSAGPACCQNASKTSKEAAKAAKQKAKTDKKAAQAAKKAPKNAPKSN